MAHPVELRYGVPSIGADNGTECWNITELTLEDVALIRNALSVHNSTKARELADAITRELDDQPEATDIVARHTRNLGDR